MSAFIRSRLALCLVVSALMVGCSKSPSELVVSAKKYMEKGDTNAAAIELKNALEKQPDNAEARFLLGQTMIVRGDYQAAEGEFRRAVKNGYDADKVMPLLAQVMVATGQTKKVAEEFEGFGSANPAIKARVESLVGDALLDMGERAKAEAAYNKALKSQPESPDAQIGLARIRAGRGDREGAEKAVDAVIAASPSHLHALLLKGELAGARGDRAAAKDAFAKVTSLDPRHGGAWFVLVSMQLQDGQKEAAKTSLDTFLKNSVGDPRAVLLSAIVKQQEGDFPGARELILQVLRVAPDNTIALVVAGELELAIGNPTLAEGNFNRALSLAPQLRSAEEGLVLTYLRSRRPALALERVEPLVKRFPNESRIQSLAGEVYLANNRLGDATQAFERATALSADNKAAQARLSQTYLAMGADDRASKTLERLRASDPNSNQADLIVVTSSLQRREFPKSIAAIESIEKRTGASAMTYTLRGMVDVGKGDTSAARKNFELALEKDKGYAAAAFNLAALDAAAGNNEAAQKRYQQILESDPRNATASRALASTLRLQGRPESEIRAAYEKAAAANPTLMQARADYIAYLIQAKDYKAAVTAAQAAIVAIPDRPELLELLVKALAASGEFSQAQAMAAKLAGLLPDNPRVPMLQSLVAADAKDYDAAIRFMRPVVDKIPNDITPAQQLAGFYVAAGQTQTGLREARDLQRTKPAAAAGYALEGNILALGKDWEGADQAFSKGVKATGLPALALRRLQGLDAAGKSADAERAGQDWLKEHPKDPLVRIYQAERALVKGDYQGAIKQYSAVIDLMPGNAAAYNNLAYAAGKVGDPKALQYAEKAMSIAPGAPDILDTYGTLLVSAGRTKEGIGYLQRAAALAPTNPVIRLNYAEALLRTDKAAARKEIEAVLAMPAGKLLEQRARDLLSKT